MRLGGVTLVFIAVVLAGCNSTGVGNPPRATVSLGLVSDDQVEPGSEGPGAAVLPDGTVTHAVLAFGEIRWRACDEGGSDAVIDGPILVDLVTHRVEPELPAVAVPQAGFCGIDATLAPASAPSSVAGRSVFFSGKRDDGVAFILFADLRGTLRMRPRLDVAWDFFETPFVLWALRPRRWLDASALNDAESEPFEGVERVVVIDLDRHPTLFELIRARLAGASTLHLDLDADGGLDPDESSDETWIGSGLPSLD